MRLALALALMPIALFAYTYSVRVLEWVVGRITRGRVRQLLLRRF
jgi:hypothetical protein